MSVTDPLASAPLEIRSLIRGVADHLRNEFEGIFSAETIRSSAASKSRATAGSACSLIVTPAVVCGT